MGGSSSVSTATVTDTVPPLVPLYDGVLLEVGEAGRQSAIGELSSPLFPDNDSIDGGCEEEREMKGREAKLAVCDCVTAAGRRRNAAALFFLVDCLVDCLEHWNDTKALQ